MRGLAQVLSLVDEAGTEQILPGKYGVEFGVENAAEGKVARGNLVVAGEVASVFTMPDRRESDQARTSNARTGGS